MNHDLAGQVRAFSAGVAPKAVNPRAVRAMAELGIDISGHRSKSMSEFEGQPFDLVITVCDSAREQCPMFPGAARMLHVGFEDPGRAQGTDEEVMAVFRRVRDEMREQLIPLLQEQLAVT